MTNKKIEEELVEVLSSYDKHDDVYSFIDVIMSYNEKGVDKQTLIETLNNILTKLDETQRVQDDIIGDILDYITGWATPLKNTKEYELFMFFNSSVHTESKK